MSLVKNTPAANHGNDTISLLSFANDASSSIQEAFSKPTKKRKENIRKFIQKRVKRLNGAPASSKGVRSANDQQTKSKSALNKTSQRRSPSTVPLPSHSQSLPYLNRPSASSSISALNNLLQPSYSESNLYPQRIQPLENHESALDDILTFLGIESSTSSTPTMSRCSSDSTTCVPPPQSILESQLPLAEHPLIDHPYSPYSDCSDELDSVYSSPSSSGRSYNCSPLPPTQAVSTGCEWTPSQSPALTSAQYPVTSACNWMSGYGPQTTVAGFEYLPYHQSPPCDQVLLSPTAIWDSMNYPENF